MHENERLVGPTATSAKTAVAVVPGASVGQKNGDRTPNTDAKASAKARLGTTATAINSRKIGAKNITRTDACGNTATRATGAITGTSGKTPLGGGNAHPVSAGPKPSRIRLNS